MKKNEEIGGAELQNAMTVDVEDYFQVSAFEGHIERDQWESLPSRVEGNTDRVLAMFESNGTYATFFVLGWVAERFPELTRRIVDGGHEIASHGFAHVRVSEQSPQEFMQDITRAKKLLEDTCGHAVQGFRAASFSIGANDLWALDALEDAGYRYSSSIYPIRHDLYGMPNAPRFPFRNRQSGILEIPITTVSAINYNLPCGGGGYFRLLPYSLYRWGLRHVNKQEGQPGVFYFHPWEIDPEQPRQKGVSLKTRIRHYSNLGLMEHRLGQLLKEFRWGRMDEIFLGLRENIYEAAVIEEQ